MPETDTRINKARYWWAVLWQENLIPDWENKLADLVQVPFAYATHDLDKDSKSEHRKDHVHLILAFSNTTTYAHALNIFKLLGDKAVNTCQAIIDIRHAYDYLIHDTENCRKLGKYQYDKEHRVLGNGFDIGMYEQLGEAEKNEMCAKLADLIIGQKIMNLADFYIIAMEQFGFEYFQIIKANNAFFDRLCRGNYLKYENGSQQHENGSSVLLATWGNDNPATRQQHGNKCPECGSADVKKQGKTAADLQRFMCKECGKTWSE